MSITSSPASRNGRSQAKRCSRMSTSRNWAEERRLLPARWRGSGRSVSLLGRRRPSMRWPGLQQRLSQFRSRKRGSAQRRWADWSDGQRLQQGGAVVLHLCGRECAARRVRSARRCSGAFEPRPAMSILRFPVERGWRRAADRLARGGQYDVARCRAPGRSGCSIRPTSKTCSRRALSAAQRARGTYPLRRRCVRLPRLYRRQSDGPAGSSKWARRGP